MMQSIKSFLKKLFKIVYFDKLLTTLFNSQKNSFDLLKIKKKMHPKTT